MFHKKLLCLLLLVLGTFALNAQNCADYQTVTLNNPPDDCSAAADLVPAFNTCKKICVDLTNATASTPAPSCGWTPHKDVWFKIHNPYTEFNNFDGSVVIAWKQLPDPAHNPTVASYAAVQGTAIIGGFIPVAVNDVCGDQGFQPVTCANDSIPDTGNQLILPAGTIPTAQQIEDGINANPPSPLTSISVDDYTFWFQLENYQSTGGTICFEVSSYQSGFSCSDPTLLAFANTGSPQTQTISRCLCKSAQNGGYFNASNTPCTVGTDYNSTTAFYQIDAPYDCNNLSFDLTGWTGTGSVNATLLSNVQCPEVTINAQAAPGQKVTAADVIASECLSIGGTTTLNATCLPAGTYYLLISGADDKAAFSGNVNLLQSTPPNPGIPLLAKVVLQGAYNGTNMNTTLRTNNLLPTAQPFNTAPFNYQGTETVANAAAIPANAVDWVLIELRDDTNTNIVERRAAFVAANGDIIDTDGTTGVKFYAITAGNAYNMAIRTRNHLAVVSRLTQTLPNTTAFDFTLPANIQAGANQLAEINANTYALKAGDINADGVINYADFNAYISPQGSTTYNPADLNLNGNITIADFDLFRQNVSAIAVPAVR